MARDTIMACTIFPEEKSADTSTKVSENMELIQKIEPSRVDLYTENSKWII